MRTSVCAVFLLIALSVFSESAYACMCRPPKNPYRSSKAVFFGELVEIVQDLGSTRVVKFKVEKYWKGIKGESITVITTGVVPCGYNFRVGEKYLIYAGRENGQLETAPCRILHVDAAEDDLRMLGRGKAPKRSLFLPPAPPNKALQLTAR